MSQTSLSVEKADLVVELSRQALAAQDVPSAIIPMLQSLVDHTAAEGAVYLQARDNHYFARAASGVLPEAPIMTAILTEGVPDDTAIIEALRGSSIPLFYDDTRVNAETAVLSEMGVNSLAAAAVSDTHGGMLGVFLMHTFKAHSWTGPEIELFSALSRVPANLAALLVAEEQAEHAREGSLRALGVSLEFRGDEISGHTDRVTDLSLRLACFLGLDYQTMNDIKWGSYLHDVGKLSIPDSILNKTGELDDSDWEAVRKHPETGHAFACQLGFLPRQSLDLIYAHHEKWDGTGYPRQLAGYDIPLSARIFAVCDVYDALVSDRPYRPAWSKDHALRIVADLSGSHFDPDLVAAFLALM